MEHAFDNTWRRAVDDDVARATTGWRLRSSDAPDGAGRCAARRGEVSGRRRAAGSAPPGVRQPTGHQYLTSAECA